MSNKITPLAAETVAIAKWLKGLIDQGLDRDAVLERIADPAGVGAGMIDRAIARRDAGADYLGRGSEVMREIDDAEIDDWA